MRPASQGKYYVFRLYDFIDTVPYGDGYNVAYAITAVNITNNDFTIAGDQTALFHAGMPFTLVNSTGNNGRWVVYASTLVGGATVISVTGDITNAVADGTIITDRNITYQWRSGWLNLGTKDFKSLLTFFLRARWEGTPDPATDTLTIGYKIDTWTNFETLKPKEILEYDEIPFPAFAYGREVQIQLTYVTKTSIPIVDEFGFTFRPYPAVRD